LLAMLCRFLSRLTEHSDRNRMTSTTLGTLLAPTILLRLQQQDTQQRKPPAHAQEMLKEIKAAQNVIAMLIEEHGVLFSIDEDEDDRDGAADSPFEDTAAREESLPELHDMEGHTIITVDCATDGGQAHSPGAVASDNHTVERALPPSRGMDSP